MSRLQYLLSASLLAATVQIAAAPAPLYAQSQNQQTGLNVIIDEYWAYQLEQNPIFASSLGVADPEGRVGDVSLEAEDKRAAKAKEWLAQLDKIDQKNFTESDRTNFGILQRTLMEQVEANNYPQRSMNFTTYSTWHQNFAGMHDNLPFKNIGDYRSYVNRLAQYGTVHSQNIAVANRAIADGQMQTCVALTGLDQTITGLITKDPKKSRYYEPFAKAAPSTIDKAEFAREAARAEQAITSVIYPALNEQLSWYQTKYLPKCVKSPGISALPGGDKYYDFRIRQMTTTNKSADEIHNIGLSEVARIRTEMESVSKSAGYKSREAFIEHLRTDPQYYAKTPEELMEKVARVTKEIDGKMPTIIGKLARLPYGIREIPAETAEGTTTAYYNPGSPNIGISGTYYVNSSKLDQRPFWEIPALSVHEAVPGHHQQIALQQELDIPDFRKYGAFFTAFVEGWGLYSERLGIEIGLYDTPAKDMGRLSYEMWRATRLVVDTGIHSKGWSKLQAIDYMTDNTALSAANIEAEVNRYISWPGQALAYKIGELKIRELRAKAEKTLGAKFDLREFHDVVLGQGAVPLDVLDAQVNRWLKSKS